MLSIPPDGGILASAGRDTKIRLWGRAHRRTPENYRWTYSKVLNHWRIQPTVRCSRVVVRTRQSGVWDVHTGKRLRTLTGHTSDVYSLIFSPDGKTLASMGARWGRFGFGMLIREKPLRTISDHTLSVHSVAFSPDGSTFTNTGMADNTIPLRDVQTGELLKNALMGIQILFCSIMYSPDGRTLAGWKFGGTDLVCGTRRPESGYIPSPSLNLKPICPCLFAG